MVHNTEPLDVMLASEGDHVLSKGNNVVHISSGFSGTFYISKKTWKTNKDIMKWNNLANTKKSGPVKTS